MSEPVRIAVCSAVGDGTTSLLSSLAGWECSVFPALPSLLDAREAYGASVVANARPEDAAHVEALVHKAAAGPVILAGGVALPGVSCWLPSASPALAGVLGSLIHARAQDAAAGEITWRRKGDMIIGNSRATQQLLHTLNQVGPSQAPVLVTGESGTGKELVARALHYGGPRSRAPFIAVNCAAIPETLFEAELFGYERGAFTGAVSPHAGAFEVANRGTLFLDEIGEVPRSMQAKFLRVLETGEVNRLGSTAPKQVAVRVVAATNRPLDTEVRTGRFREDLYYRLRVYPIHLLPLRQRPEDIPPITAHHLSLIAAREKGPQHRMTPAGLLKLLSYSWPGNTRELVNVLERACLVAEGPDIQPEHIVLPTADAPTIAAYRDAKTHFEQHYYTQVLRTAGGNVSLAAKLAQKTRKEVYDAVKRLGLQELRQAGLAPARSDQQFKKIDSSRQ